MSFWQPQTVRGLAEFFSNCVAKWDALTPEEKAECEFINPDEPVVLRVLNPEWVEGEDGPYEPDDDGNDTHLCYHVESHGGGGDQDESGNDISHDGAMLTGMEINQAKFYCNGRRHET